MDRLSAAAPSVHPRAWPDVGALMIAVFVIPAAFRFHRFWDVEDQMQRMTQVQLFWRNMIALRASTAMFGMFVALGDALRFTITGRCSRSKHLSRSEVLVA